MNLKVLGESLPVKRIGHHLLHGNQHQHTAKVSKSFRMTAETVCDVLVCGECLKPRCVYSKRKLTKDEFNKLAIYKENFLYCCGGSIFPEEDEDINLLCAHEILDGCNDNISPHYTMLPD